MSLCDIRTLVRQVQQQQQQQQLLLRFFLPRYHMIGIIVISAVPKFHRYKV
jgi:hypothetical protein